MNVAVIELRFNSVILDILGKSLLKLCLGCGVDDECECFISVRNKMQLDFYTFTSGARDTGVILFWFLPCCYAVVRVVARWFLTVPFRTMPIKFQFSS